MAADADEKRHGLWDVMRRKSATETQPPDNAQSEETATGKSLWSVMSGESATSSTAETAPAPGWFRGKSAVEENEVYEADLDPSEDSSDPPTSPAFEPKPKPKPQPKREPVQSTKSPGLLVVDPEETPMGERLSNLSAKTGRSRGAILALLVGLLACPLTLFAARPELWARIPATVLGFGAVVIGLMAFNEIRQSRGRQTGSGIAIIAMILGTVSMFLGPLVIAPLSEKQSQSNKQAETRDRLKSIGVALKKWHDGNGRFPPGGTYRANPATGKSIALHSWTTHLLPYLGGGQSMYRQIDFDVPWNDPKHQGVMTQEVPAFLSGDGQPGKNDYGYGLAHFSGVGGQVQLDNGSRANAGIFARSSQVSRGDIADGLSQTLVVGEIAEGYRPWGEPGNWRTIGDGLNRDESGFGNASKSGALFLHADGSVRFYSNQVAPNILKSLSTRDGVDSHQIPKKMR